MKPKIQTKSIRQDCEDYFAFITNEAPDCGNRPPYLLLFAEEYELKIKAERNLQSVLEYPAGTMVIANWPGKKRSDYFVFDVYQLKEYIEKHAKI